MAQFGYGQTVKFSNTWKVDGVATDPTTVTLWVEDPNGTETSYTYAASTVSKTSTGVYYKALRLGTAGTWKYRWIGTGTAAQETPDITVSVGSTVFSTV